jgi:uncharacterized protein (DUF983 family)
MITGWYPADTKSSKVRMIIMMSMVMILTMMILTMMILMMMIVMMMILMMMVIMMMNAAMTVKTVMITGWYPADTKSSKVRPERLRLGGGRQGRDG